MIGHRARGSVNLVPVMARGKGAPMSRAHEPAATGMTVTHRRYVPYSHAHYAGNLVDGAYSLAAFGDVATEMCIRTDGDEGLFASYSDVQFRAPVRAGDCIQIQATLVRVGTRSREMSFELAVVTRSSAAGRESAAVVLSQPLVATTAVGVVVVPASI
jgi:3-aminobutyryl-CoA ammonia-lyase